MPRYWVLTHQGPPQVATELLQKLWTSGEEEVLLTKLLSHDPMF